LALWGPPNLAALFVLFSFRRGHFDSKEITDNIQLQTRMWFGTIVRQEPHAGKNSLELKRLAGGCGAQRNGRTAKPAEERNERRLASRLRVEQGG